MGGNSKLQPAPTASPSPMPMASSVPQQATQTFPGAMPGQLEAIAAQLSAGYGQKPADILSYLQGIYKPQTTTGPLAPPAAAPKATLAPAAPSAVARSYFGIPGNVEIMYKGGDPKKGYFRTDGGGWAPTWMYDQFK